VTPIAAAVPPAFDRILDGLGPGLTVYVPGASGESLGLCAGLQRQPDRAAGVQLVSCLVPGINTFDYASVSPSAVVTTFMLPQALRSSFEAGRVRVLPLSYTQIYEYLGGRVPLDIAVAHVAPADETGHCSLGTAADFTPAAWRQARRRMAIVNHAMPAMPRGPRIALSEADVLVEVDDPLVASEGTTSPPTTIAIADRVAGLVANGATVQMGIGGVPGAVWERLSNHRGIVIRSGIVAEGVMTLADSGALGDPSLHRAGIAFGSCAFYQWLAERDLVAFASVPETHGVEALAMLPRFTSINSAFEVDLFGQVNIEWQSGQLMSGVGGAPEFIRAAHRSPGGRAIIALPASTQGKAISRIVPQLSSPTVSIPRYDVDTVITEYGVAELRGRSLEDRATALIAVADPVHSETLSAAWYEMRKKL
jgi:acyl-CoA hydrolase